MEGATLATFLGQDVARTETPGLFLATVEESPPHDDMVVC
jgi:hypothetical protein